MRDVSDSVWFAGRVAPAGVVEMAGGTLCVALNSFSPDGAWFLWGAPPGIPDLFGTPTIL